MLQGRLMDGEGDQTNECEERLREVFQSFDGTGAGSLSPEELVELCSALQLTDTAIDSLQNALFNTQNQLDARVEFEQFKNALIAVFSQPEETLANEEKPQPPDSPEVQPRFVKGTKRYGRRSTPEFSNSFTEVSPTLTLEIGEEEATRSNDRNLSIEQECWNDEVSSPEEYEAEGQLHLWNPDEPGTPRGSTAPLSDLEERLQSACLQLSLPLHGTATSQQLRVLCQHLGLEVGEDAFQSAGEMSVQEFVTCIQNNNKPPTPSASTPYRQLKRHHSMQPFDEMGRRISSVMSSTIGLRLFSELDDGTGHTAVELLLDTWLEEGVENSSQILKALEFSLDGKVNLNELTAALENELMVTKNSIHQAALASFKAEIRYLLERVDLELREKEKIRSDLEKAEKLKSQMASEVDEHHSAIERLNHLNLRKLEEEHKERVVALRTEHSKELELVQQQANQQREELEQEINRIKEEETFLRDRLTLTIKENGRLEAELLDSKERLVEAEAQMIKLQRNLDSVLREKFGDLDLSNAEFYQQEERLRQLRNSYEEQCRELKDRIDELQAQLDEFRTLGRPPQTSIMPSLSDELDNESPGMELDQGLGSEEGQQFNLSLEAEMLLEQLKEQHVREMENIRAQLNSTVNECEHKLTEQKATQAEKWSLLSLQHEQEVKTMRQEVNEAVTRAEDLQEQLEQEKNNIEARHSAERAELQALYQQQVSSISQEAKVAMDRALQLEEQLRVLEEQVRGVEESRARERDELNRAHAEKLSRLELHYQEILETSLQAERERLQAEWQEAEERLKDERGKEKKHLEQIHEEVLRVQLKEVEQRAEQERIKLENRLRHDFQMEKQNLVEENKKATQVALDEELARIQKEQEAMDRRLREQWLQERSLLEAQHTTELNRLQEKQERRKIEELEIERVQLQEQHEQEIQARLEGQRATLQAEIETQKRLQEALREKQGQIEAAHREALHELSAKHQEERERLSCMLEKLRTDISEERKELELHFAHRITEVEAHFSDDQDTVLKRFQKDICNLEQNYQSELAALAQSHAADRARWEEEIEIATQEAEQQRRLLRQAMQLELENVVQELTEEQTRLKQSHVVEMEALKEKYLLLQVELENCKETQRELDQLHNQLGKNLEEKDALDRAAELEQILRQAMDDFAKERAELLNSFFDLQSCQAQTVALAAKQQHEQSKSIKEREELVEKMEAVDQLLFQLGQSSLQLHTLIVQVFNCLLETFKESIFIVDLNNEDRTALMADRCTVMFKLHQMKTKLEEVTRVQILSKQIVQEFLPSGLSSESADDFIVCDVYKDYTPDHLKCFSDLRESLLGELDGNFEGQKKYADGFEGEKLLSCSEDNADTNFEPECFGSIEGAERTIEGVSSLSGSVIAFGTKLVELDTDQHSGLTEDHTLSITHVGIESTGVTSEEDKNPNPESSNEIAFLIFVGGEMPEFVVCDPIELENAHLDDATDNPKPDCLQKLYSCLDQKRELHCSHRVGVAVPSNAPFTSLCSNTEFNPELKLVDARLVCVCQEGVQDDPSKAGAISEDLDQNIEVVKDDADSRIVFDIRHMEAKLEMAGVEAKKHKTLENADTIKEVVMTENAHKATFANDADLIEVNIRKNQLWDNEVLSKDYESMALLLNIDETSNDANTTCPQDQIIVFPSGSILQEPHGLTIHPIETLDLRKVAVPFEYHNSLQELNRDHYRSPLEQNISLLDQLAWQQQHTAQLQLLLNLSKSTLIISQQALRKSNDLRVELIAMAAQAKELEMKTLELAELQVRHEECVCENVKLTKQKGKLEKKVEHLNSKMNVIQDFEEVQSCHLEQIVQLHKENENLTKVVQELETQNYMLLAELSPHGRSLMSLKITAVSELEDCCFTFEEQNPDLHLAFTYLQKKSLMINKLIQEHRREAGRLTEENLVLRQKISGLMEEEQKENQQKLLLQVEQLQKERNATQKMADGYKRQISELRRRGKQLEEENNALSEQNAKHAQSVDTLQHTLDEVMQQHATGQLDTDEDFLGSASRTKKLEEEKKLLRAELNRCVEKMAQLRSAETQLAQLLQERQTADKHNQVLRTQLIKAQDKVQALDSTLQGLTQQNARFKSDLRITSQERDALKQEVISLHKRLQNVNEKCRLVEKSVSGVAGLQRGKRVWAELSGLMEAEVTLLREENQRLQREIDGARLELSSAREKARQLESLVLSMKQQKQQNQISLTKAAEQERSALKREIDALQTQLHSKLCNSSEEQREIENLQEQNERLRNKQTVLEAQLMEAQLIAMLPPSPIRLSGELRGQLHADEMNPDINVQEERELALLKMEQRMKEVEFTLRNVKLLLQEKVSQLKEQLNKNNKADVLIKDLYMENSQLLKALEVSEQRQKVAEKKNYLLEEKIFSLNKIVRELRPSPLTPVPYHLTRSYSFTPST